MIEIRPSKVKFNEKEFNNFQKELGINLPKEYIKFLKEYNGGIPELNIVELQNEEVKSFSVTEFFGVNNEKINDLKSQYETYKERIPSENIPICRAEGGNIVCLNIDNGLISFWDHDTELLNENVSSANSLLRVATNFEEFLSLMEPYYYNEDDLADYKVEDVWIDPDFLKELKNDKD
ncbi:SMI1/KNR4 family protein [Aquisalibacillus elongatus]|uniref:SUKH superfamily protein n=1 Tax=Aquisalibacillus elongatus TaxID=485577 RepID=A0A3N5B9J1_9BACI|nr:SMI1/KNR4 family protein [Aquisalibacillus elongatus]RPF54144.1 SUKH superfamily protein [Aquisalibacillus elongatus]